eukprot:83631-Rhodomonas_salina.1
MVCVLQCANDAKAVCVAVWTQYDAVCARMSYHERDNLLHTVVYVVGGEGGLTCYPHRIWS